ncbi:hypothetical protein [Paenibacillus guangzhouensis]|uniref:hypothetical protein n=1 Tax=Paenibacillus guangzhouensis TaxID=1473112 RepID=UPI001266E4EF|nr:hypothetical protein [Paenibacillus guangzhouensis]
MMKSPGGSIFPYPYKGGEIHCLKYGSKYTNEAALFTVMQQEEAFILQMNRKLKIWVDLYHTTITARVLSELVNHLRNLEERIVKVSFVGVTGINRWRLQRQLKRSGVHLIFSFYADPEEAKTWLVNEH